MTNLDPCNVDDDKKIFYSQVDSQLVAELINHLLTNAEYSKLMLKNNMFTFQDDTTDNKIIDGPLLLKLLFDRINPKVFLGVGVIRQKPKAKKINPHQTMSMICSWIWKNTTRILSTIKVLANRYVDTC